jgi:hypothetical protein
VLPQFAGPSPKVPENLSRVALYRLQCFHCEAPVPVPAQAEAIDVEVRLTTFHFTLRLRSSHLIRGLVAGSRGDRRG